MITRSVLGPTLLLRNRFVTALRMATTESTWEEREVEGQGARWPGTTVAKTILMGGVLAAPFALLMLRCL